MYLALKIMELVYYYNLEIYCIALVTIMLANLYEEFPFVLEVVVVLILLKVDFFLFLLLFLENVHELFLRIHLIFKIKIYLYFLWLIYNSLAFYITDHKTQNWLYVIIFQEFDVFLDSNYFE